VTRPIRVLHLEDSPRDAEVIHHKLEVDGVRCDIVLANSKDSFEAALVRESFDLILSDYNLPGYDGTAAIERAQERQPDTPVIVISGSLGEDEAVKCLHIGATDYLLKQRLDRLAPAVQRAIQEAEERRRRKEAEQALLERERRLSSVYETVSDSLFYVDVEEDGRYRFTSVNQAFVSTTGLDHNQVVGKRVDEVIPEPSLTLVLEKYGEAIRERRVVRWEETSEYPNGRLTGEVSIAPVFDDAGSCTHLVGAVHDITERQRLEAQFRQSQKMESVGQLAGGIAHDFNNLLTVIIGMAELGLAQLREGDQLHEDLQEIRRAGERAAAMTRQLLAFSRKQILQPQVLNLNTVVAGMETMLRRLIGEDIDLVVVPTEGLGSVKADPGQMEQVIANLAVNARDAMPQGGKLTIELQNVEIDEQYARQHSVAVQPGPCVMLAMSDTGVGMDAVTRGRIFEPFFTTKGPGKGTGLGLSTVYGIVKQSNGFIWVCSEVGQGTSFKIHLPQVAEVVGSKRQSPTIASAHGTETILVVEDVGGLRSLAKRMLESLGYTVLTATDGEDALRLLEDYRGPVHLVLTDVVMPGMGGRTLAERFGRTRPEMKVLYMSGYTDDVILRHGVFDEGMPFLGKPFTVVDLTLKVREVLDSQSRHLLGSRLK
jgi:two-component system cell cycle sensor histidine kinase/response regulator CckA